MMQKWERGLLCSHLPMWRVHTDRLRTQPSSPTSIDFYSIYLELPLPKNPLERPTALGYSRGSPAPLGCSRPVSDRGGPCGSKLPYFCCVHAAQSQSRPSRTGACRVLNFYILSLPLSTMIVLRPCYVLECDSGFISFLPSSAPVKRRTK